MATERTLAIIKPDAVGRGLTGEILKRIHEARFQIAAIKSLRLTKTEAEGFYAVHRERPFFKDLTECMSSGKVVVMALEAENAISRWRETTGATDPAKAAPGTIRKSLGTSIQNNCTHGSDAPETVQDRIFFRGDGTDLRERQGSKPFDFAQCQPEGLRGKEARRFARKAAQRGRKVQEHLLCENEGLRSRDARTSRGRGKQRPYERREQIPRPAEASGTQKARRTLVADSLGMTARGVGSALERIRSGGRRRDWK